MPRFCQADQPYCLVLIASGSRIRQGQYAGDKGVDKIVETKVAQRRDIAPGNRRELAEVGDAGGKT